MSHKDASKMSLEEALVAIESLFSTIKARHEDVNFECLEIARYVADDKYSAALTTCDFASAADPERMNKRGNHPFNMGDTIAEAIVNLFEKRGDCVPIVGSDWVLRVFVTKEHPVPSRPLRVAQFDYNNRAWVDLPIDEWW